METSLLQPNKWHAHDQNGCQYTIANISMYLACEVLPWIPMGYTTQHHRSTTLSARLCGHVEIEGVLRKLCHHKSLPLYHLCFCVLLKPAKKSNYMHPLAILHVSTCYTFTSTSTPNDAWTNKQQGFKVTIRLAWHVYTHTHTRIIKNWAMSFSSQTKQT